MAAPTQFVIIVDQGGSAATITIPISVSSGDAEIVRSQAMAICRGGFWDSTQQNFYPPSAIRKVTPG